MYASVHPSKQTQPTRLISLYKVKCLTRKWSLCISELYSTPCAEASAVIETGVASLSPAQSPHPPYTNGLLNGQPANVWVDFLQPRSVRLNIRQCTYWFSNKGEIGWESGSSVSNHKSRVRRALWEQVVPMPLRLEMQFIVATINRTIEILPEKTLFKEALFMDFPFLFCAC